MSSDGFQVPIPDDALFREVVDKAMADGELPAQLNEVHRAWPESMNNVLVLSTAVQVRVLLRGVTVQLQVTYTTWPRQPPALTVVDMPWTHPNILPSGRVAFLDGQKTWNRTVTMADLLHELDRRFLALPPQKKFRITDVLRRAWHQWRGTNPDADPE